MRLFAPLHSLLPPRNGLVRRRLERRIYHTHWYALLFAFVLVLILHAKPLWLSLVALAGYALHNMIRRVLIADASASWMHGAGGILLALDIVIALVGMWPMVTDGARAIQATLILLLLEAVRWLRFEPPPVFASSVLLLTAALCGYTVWIGHYGEEWRSTVVWSGLLIAVAVGSLISHRKRPLGRKGMRYSGSPAVDPLQANIEAIPEPFVSETETPLSPRQREIVRHLARGLSTREIADELSLSVETVRGHLKSAYRNLRTHSREEAIRRARERGEIP